MVICKYFPSCRYGDNCKFDHIYPSGQQFSRGNTQQYYANNSYFQHANRSPVQKHTGSAMDVSEVMKVVIQEIMQAEKGGQWPLSCFSPIKERPCFPGMLDYSPEEIRWRMYEANKNGTLAECQRQIKELHEGAKQKRNYLKNPSGEIYAMIDKYYGPKADVSAGNPAFSVDSTKTQNNTFAFSTQSFGNSQHNAQTPISNTNFKFSLPQLQSGNVIPQQQSILGGGSNFQASQLANNQASIFGGMGNPATAPQGFGGMSQNISALQTTPQNTFGRAVTGNVFGNVGVDAVQAQSMNIFGAAQTKSGSIFGGGATALTQPSSIFGGAGTMPPVNNVFTAAAPSQGIFGESGVTLPTSNKVFGGSEPTSMPPTAIFGGSDTASTSSTFPTMSSAITSSESAFGRTSAISASNNTFGHTSAFGPSAGLSKPQSSVLDSSLYTLKDELNQEELSAFSANTFTLGKVPTRPPPRELCY